MHPDVLSALSRDRILAWRRTADEYRFARTMRPPKSRDPWRWHARTRVRLRGTMPRVPASTC
jgi:hypothetical protein